MEINALDRELFDYAQSLMALRLKEVLTITSSSSHSILPLRVSTANCAVRPAETATKFRQLFGIFQPPGHKGP